jgi:hypothetical protein
VFKIISTNSLIKGGQKSHTMQYAKIIQFSETTHLNAMGAPSLQANILQTFLLTHLILALMHAPVVSIL